MIEKKYDWVTRLVPSLAFAAGIIIASIGAIVTLSSSLKLAVLDSNPYGYVTTEDCRYDYARTVPETGDSYERTDAEVATCIAERKLQALENFQNDKKNSMVDGISMLIVGGFLVLAFRKNKQ